MLESRFGPFFNSFLSRIGFAPLPEESPSNLPQGFYPSPFPPEHEARRSQYRMYWKYYEGNQRPPLRIDGASPDLNHIENYCKTIVDMSATFLINDGIRFETDTEQEQSEAEALLEEVLGKRLQSDVVQAGGVTGVPALRIYPIDGANPRVVVVDPASLEIFVDPADRDSVTEYRQTWWAGSAWNRHRMINESGAWVTVVESRGANGVWNESERVAWAYNCQPMYHAQNLPLAFGVYGMSDLTDASLQDAVNRVASDTDKILHHHAAPVTVATGLQGHKIIVQKTGGSSIVKIPTGTTLNNLELQSDLSASTATTERTINAMYAITGTPRMGAEQVQLGAVSGTALLLSMYPALQKMNQKRLTYGRLFSDVAAAVLEVSGMPQPVEVAFGNPLPDDEDGRVGRYVSLVNAGTDRYAAARVAGYSIEDAKLLAARVTVIPTSPLDDLL